MRLTRAGEPTGGGTAATSTAPQVVGLYGRAARTLALVFLFSEFTRGIPDGPPGFFGWHVLGAMLICAVMGAVLLWPGPDPVPIRNALLLVVLAPLPGALTVFALREPHENLVNGMWTWTLMTTCMSFLAVRGRPVLAWCGALLVAAVYFRWAQLHGWQAGFALAPALVWQFLLLSVCTVFALAMRNQVRRINETRRRGAELAAARAESEARLRERDEQLDYLRSSAWPQLERLRARAPLSPRDRLELLVLEARLRDRIRARGLATQELLDAAAHARLAGATVILLDDHGLDDVDDETAGAVRGAVLRELADDGCCDGATVTVRVHPPGRDVLCTIVASGPHAFRRTELRKGAAGVSEELTVEDTAPASGSYRPAVGP